MIRKINQGGEESFIRLSSVPGIEAGALILESSFSALSAWKARPGEIITVIDPDGRFHRARITIWDGSRAEVHVFAPFPENHESLVRITVFQAVPEKERFELILQKLTEIGVFAIVPFVSKRSITVAERDSSQKKSHKWPDVLIRAARQCRRGMIPVLGEALSWDEVMMEAKGFDRAIILTEHMDGVSIKDVLAGLQKGSICLLTGPEGGFSRKEVAAAVQEGLSPVSLGSRILRTETASIVASTIAVHETGGFL